MYEATEGPRVNFVMRERHYSSLHRLMSLHGKLNVKISLIFIVAENTRGVNIYYQIVISLSKISILLFDTPNHIKDMLTFFFNSISLYVLINFVQKLIL